MVINDFFINFLMFVGIVVGVLCIFMGWCVGLIVGIVFFLIVVGMFFFMNMMLLEMEWIFLGVLIIVMGMLVDNVIVVIEGMLIGVLCGKFWLVVVEDVVKFI